MGEYRGWWFNGTGKRLIAEDDDMLYIRLGNSKNVVDVACATATGHPNTVQAISKAMKTLVFEPSVQPSQTERLPFRLSPEGTGLNYAGIDDGKWYYTFNGKMPGRETPVSMVEVRKPFWGMDSPDPLEQAKREISNHSKSIEFLEENKIMIDGVQAGEVKAKWFLQKMDQDIYAYILIVPFKDGSKMRFWWVKGFAMEEYDAKVAAFQKLGRSFRFK